MKHAHQLVQDLLLHIRTGWEVAATVTYTVIICYYRFIDIYTVVCYYICIDIYKVICFYKEIKYILKAKKTKLFTVVSLSYHTTISNLMICLPFTLRLLAYSVQALGKMFRALAVVNVTARSQKPTMVPWLKMWLVHPIDSTKVFIPSFGQEAVEFSTVKRCFRLCRSIPIP